MITIKNKLLKPSIIAVVLVIIMILSTVYENNIIKSKNINTDIYTVVKEAFITDKGFSEEFSKHIPWGVFNEINVYNVYAVNSPEYKKPFKVDFSLKEDSKTLISGILIVKMTYSVEIKDSQGTSIGGSWDIPATFTIRILGDNWYILNESEPA